MHILRQRARKFKNMSTFYNFLKIETGFYQIKTGWAKRKCQWCYCTYLAHLFSDKNILKTCHAKKNNSKCTKCTIKN